MVKDDSLDKSVMFWDSGIRKIKEYCRSALGDKGRRYYSPIVMICFK